MSSNQINAINKTAAFHIYADLCENQNFANVKPCLHSESNYLYFETNRRSNSDSIELILPLEENQYEFNPSFLLNIINGIDNSKKFKLGIVSSDFTTVYYDCSQGIECPFEKEHYLKVNK